MVEKIEISKKINEMLENGDLNPYVMWKIMKAIHYTHAIFFKIRMQGNTPVVQGFVKDRLIFSETTQGQVKDVNIILIKNLIVDSYGLPKMDYKLMTLEEAVGFA